MLEKYGSYKMTGCKQEQIVYDENVQYTILDSQEFHWNVSFYKKKISLEETQVGLKMGLLTKMLVPPPSSTYVLSSFIS